MIQMLEKDREQLRNLLQATSDIIQHFKSRRSIEAFDLYPITIIDGSDPCRWHNVAGFHIAFIVKLTKTKTRKLMAEVRKFLVEQSKDSVHDPTWWDRYKLRWFTHDEITDWRSGTHKFWIELRLKRRY